MTSPKTSSARVPRRLLLVRHAKSSWKSDAANDHERPLNARGRRDAPAMAVRLAERGWTPDAIWSSDATRTRETCARMLPAFDPEPAVTFDPSLYLAGLEALTEAAARWNASWQTVLVLGHNPGWESAASRLAGESIELKTCNAVLLEGSGSHWSEAFAGDWHWIDWLRPEKKPGAAR